MRGVRPVAGVAAAGLCALLAAPLRAETSPNVVDIRVEGSERIEAETIRANIRSRVGEPFRTEKVRDDLRALWGLGYFDDVVLERQEAPNGVLLVVRVREKPFVRDVLFEGNHEIETDKLKEALKVKPKSLLDVVAIRDGLRRIEDLYTEKGYYFARAAQELVRRPRNEVDLKVKITEGDRVRVRRITFVGNRAFGDDELKAKLETQEAGFFSWLMPSSGAFREENLDKDLKAIRTYYLDRGYIHLKVDRPVIELSTDRRWISITYYLEEGFQYRVGSVDLRGDLLFDRDDLMKEVATRKGEVFNGSRVQEDVAKLSDRYADLGFANANVNTLTPVDEEHRTVAVTYEVEKGKLVYVHRINIVGNTKTRDKVIRREMRLNEGELFSASKLRLSRQRIYATGFFEEANFSTQPGEKEDEVDLNLQVKEGNTGSLSAGFGFSSIDQFIGTLQASVGNFLGYGQRISLTFEVSAIRRDFSFSYLDSYFLDTDASLGVDLFNLNRYYIDYQEFSEGGDARTGYRLGEFTRGFLSYRYETFNIATVGSTLIQLDQGLTSSLTASILMDTKDHPFDPSKGTVLNGAIEKAGGPFGGDRNFWKVTGSARQFLPLFWGAVLSVYGQVGYAFTDDLTRVPFSERFFAGGLNSVRGYYYRTLGPQTRYLTVADDPASSSQSIYSGGNKLLLTNNELTFPLIKEAGIKGLLFVDAGNVYDEGETVFSEPLRIGWGFGFRWFTPIAPFRFEWGFPILQKGENRPPFVFEFSIGTFF